MAAIVRALPGYEIDGELGQGAWGVVLGGRHRRLDRRVAIKQLPPFLAADTEVASRFLREAQTAAALDHPHIVPVYDYVEDGDLALIVMERCEGTVEERRRAGALGLDAACAAVLATCSALAYAHERGVLHRDIKPENLLIDASEVVKLGDFGIARAADGAIRLTATGTVMGTPAYMSPEQCRGAEVGPASDLYSLGVVLYELVSGSLPFPQAESIGAVLQEHMFGQPRPLSEAAPAVPAPVAEVAHRALAKNPAHRWPSATAFGVALAQASVEALGPGWLRHRGFDLLGAPEIAAAAEEATPVPDPKPPSRAPAFVARPPASAGAAHTPGLARVEDRPRLDWGGWVAALALAGLMIVLVLAVAASWPPGAQLVGGGEAGPGTSSVGFSNQPVDVNSTTTAPALTTAGWTTTSGPPPAGSLVIGTLVDGGLDVSDVDQEMAVALATSEINEAGGVLGRPVTIRSAIYTDTATLVEAANAHLAAEVSAVVGPSQPVDTEEVLQLITGGDTVLVSPTDSSPREDHTGLYFQAAASRTLIGEAAVSVLDDETGSVVLLVRTPGRQSQGDQLLLEAIGGALDRRGVTLATIEVADGEEETAALEVAGFGPDAVLFYDFLSLAAIYQALSDQGLGPDVVAYLAVADDGAATGLPEGLVTGAQGISGNPSTAALAPGPLSAFDFSPEAVQAYDAVIVLALAANRAGTIRSESVAQALPQVTGQGGDPCRTYAECLWLLEEGNEVDYDGVGGPYELSATTGRPTGGFFQLTTIGDSGVVVNQEQYLFTRPAG